MSARSALELLRCDGCGKTIAEHDSMMRCHAQHTPGPWVVQTPNNIGRKSAGVWTGNGDVEIARCESSALSVEGNRVNARLIAAAPELLEALLQCAESLDFARSRLGIPGEDGARGGHDESEDLIGSRPALLAARAALAKATGGSAS